MGSLERLTGEEEIAHLSRALLAERKIATACTTAAEVKSLVDGYNNYLLDCDGVLWRGSEVLDGAIAAVNLLKRLGKKVFFVTNNSTKSRSMYAAKLAGLGIVAEKSDIISSSFAAADYIVSEHPGVKKAFVIGGEGLRAELEEHGIKVIGAQAEEYRRAGPFTEADFDAFPLDPEVGAVVCGWDMSFTFQKLCVASLYLQQEPKCPFVATNRDAFDRQPRGNLPGNGAMVAAVAASVGREPVVVGKPSAWLVTRLLERHGLVASETVMVGDRLDTDILLGKVGGIGTVLVLTGCHSVADVAALPAGSELLPDRILPGLGMLAAAAEGYSSL